MINTITLFAVPIAYIASRYLGVEGSQQQAKKEKKKNGHRHRHRHQQGTLIQYSVVVGVLDCIPKLWYGTRRRRSRR